ncbi:MAG: MATE family efflux transporter [Pseudomonadota bacterium]
MSGRDLTQGPVGWALFRMSAPMTVGIMAVISVGVADAYFLGLYGPTELAAVGFIYPITIAVLSLSIGLSAGLNTVVSQAIGRGDQEFAMRAAAHGLGFAILLGIIVAILLIIAGDAIFSLMGAQGDTKRAVLDYTFYWALSFPALVLMMAANSIVRAKGSSVVPAGLMVAVAIFNIVINPMFIFGTGSIPEMGAGGAGLATALARIVGSVAAIIYVLSLGFLKPACLTLDSLEKTIGRIAKVGGPAALSNSINPAGMAIITGFVASFGDAAVAGFGAATRIEAVIMVPMLALSSGIGPVIGQSWGAEKRDRAEQATQLAFMACIAYGLIAGAILLVFAEPIAGLIAKGDEPIRHAALYLQIVGFGLFGYGVLVVGNAANNARDKAVFSLGTSVSRIALVYIPAALLGQLLLGYFGIVIAALVANLVGAYFAVIACRSTGLLRHQMPLPIEWPATLLTRPERTAP